MNLIFSSILYACGNKTLSDFRITHDFQVSDYRIYAYINERSVYSHSHPKREKEKLVSESEILSFSLSTHAVLRVMCTLHLRH